MIRVRHLMVVAAVVILAAVVPAMAQTPFPIGPYSYDGTGNITAIGSDQYRYDELGRLVTATVAGTQQQFAYDRYGNMTSMKTGATTITIGVAPGTNRLTSAEVDHASNVTAEYDDAGNVKSYLNGSPTLEYDGMNMVTRSTTVDRTQVYLYSASDERVATVELYQGAQTSARWTLRGLDNEVRRVYTSTPSDGWKWEEDYVYQADSMLAAEVATPERTLHFHNDPLGSPRLITGNGGAFVATHTYLPFGAELGPGIPSSERKQFTGHERDASGLDYMHARYYQSGWGRFLSVDPTWESADASRPQSWNRYAYVENNPINKVDPDGKNPLGALFGGAISVTVESYKQVTCNCPVNNRRLLAALVGGAVAGATGGLGGATLRGAIGFGALGGVLGGATERGINKGEKIIDKAIVTDAVTGAIGGAAGQKLGQAMVRASQSAGTLNRLAIQGAAQRGEAAAANAGLRFDRETARQAKTLIKGITGAGDVAGNVAGEVVKNETNEVKKELDKRDHRQ